MRRGVHWRGPRLTLALCPPQAYVSVDDREDSDLAAQLAADLEKYAVLYGLSYGDPRTCTAEQNFFVNVFGAAATSSPPSSRWNCAVRSA